MKPFMPKAETALLYKYLDKATNYFEFGSGGSTYQASLKKNIKSIHTVENDKVWFDKLKNNIKSDNVNYIFIEMNIKNKSGGSPVANESKDKLKEYSQSIRKLDADVVKKIDTILIDGRFRVACALNSFDVISDDTVILFDDFKNRKFYHIVLNYYKEIEKAGRMVVLKKKKGIASPDKSLIEKYEQIHK